MALLPPARLLVWLSKIFSAKHEKGEIVPDEFTAWLNLVSDSGRADDAILNATIKRIDVTTYVGRDVSPAILCALQWLVEQRYGDAWTIHAAPVDSSELWHVTKIEATEPESRRNGASGMEF